MQGDFCDEEIAHWRRVAGSLHRARMDIVDTIAQRDVAGAVQLVRDYHRKVIKHTQSSPRATELRDADPGLTTLAQGLTSRFSRARPLAERCGAGSDRRICADR